MLALDRQMMTAHGLAMRLVEASMDDLSPLTDAGFEVVIQPVSTCYVPDITAMYREVARVTADHGLYISQHKQPVSLQADAQFSTGGYALREPYHRQGPLPVVTGSAHRETGAAEFLHRWEDLLGGLCRSGFVIEDLVEPRHADPSAAPGTFEHRSAYAPPYVTVKARRTAGSQAKLWTP